MRAVVATRKGAAAAMGTAAFNALCGTLHTLYGEDPRAMLADCGAALVRTLSQIALLKQELQLPDEPRAASRLTPVLAKPRPGLCSRPLLTA